MFQELGIGLRRNMTMTVAVVVSVGVSLSLLGVALLVRFQVETMKDYWYDKIEVSIFLCNQKSQRTPGCADGPVTEDQRNAIREDLEMMQGDGKLVKEIYFETQEQAFVRAKDQFKNTSFAEFLSPEQLPSSFRVKLNDPSQYQLVAVQFENRPGISVVQDQRRILAPFFAILRIFLYVAAGIAIVMLLVAVLLIGNTMRIAAFSRRRETAIMRLVGASNFYIQLPFIMEGAVAGFVGAGMASVTVILLKAVGIDRLLAPNLTLTAYIGWDSVIVTLWVLFAAGIALSVLASFITLRKYLHV